LTAIAAELANFDEKLLATKEENECCLLTMRAPAVQENDVAGAGY